MIEIWIVFASWGWGLTGSGEGKMLGIMQTYLYWCVGSMGI